MHSEKIVQCDNFHGGEHCFKLGKSMCAYMSNR